MARNLAPDAINLEIPGIINNIDYPGIPGITALGVHANTVHMPEVICKALYAAVHHQAPPNELEFDPTVANNRKSAPVIPSLQSTREDAGVVLLVDISESMSWGHDGARNVPVDQQRLTLVKRAIEPFLVLLEHHSQGKANLGGVVFPGLPWRQNRTRECDAQAIIPITPVKEPAVQHAARAVTCLKTNGGTPLLKGIDDAIEVFGNERRKAIILLSDGYHNCPNRATVYDQAAVKRIEALDENQVTVHAIGIGRCMETDRRLLKRLSVERTEPLKGTFIHIMDSGFDPAQPDAWHPATALKDAYKSILTSVLDLEEARDPMGIVRAGQSITDNVTISEHDRAVSFLTGWATPRAGRLTLTVKSSDNKPVPASGPGIRVQEGKTYKIITVYSEFLKQPGKTGTGPWTIEIHPAGLQPGERENYHYGVIMDSAAKMEIAFDRDRYKTGDSMTVTAAITKGGQPVTGLTGVSVEITRPVEGPGNWYAFNKISSEELASVPVDIGEESLSPLQRKALYLTQTRGIDIPRRTGPVKLPLYDDGSRGDKKSGDGIYTNRYEDTVKEGTYAFCFRSGGETLQREKQARQYVSVKPAPEYSIPLIRWLDIFPGDTAQYLYDVEWAPRDRCGNYVGPGRRVSAAIVYSDDREQKIMLTDRLDGVYSDQIAIARTDYNAGVKLEFAVDGETVTTVEKIPGFRRWSLGLYAGIAIPVYSTAWNYDPGFSLGGKIGYRLAPQFSLVGLVGRHRLTAGNPWTNAAGWWNISLNLRSEIVRNPLVVYVNVGPGIYFPTSGDTRQGFNAGAGASYSFSPGWGLEIGTDFHRVFAAGPDPNFFVLHAMMVYRF
jgi:Mg-chelatase subunit ChlD